MDLPGPTSPLCPQASNLRGVQKGRGARIYGRRSEVARPADLEADDTTGPEATGRASASDALTPRLSEHLPANPNGRAVGGGLFGCGSGRQHAVWDVTAEGEPAWRDPRGISPTA